jgi:hypothetical protein
MVDLLMWDCLGAVSSALGAAGEEMEMLFLAGLGRISF